MCFKKKENPSPPLSLGRIESGELYTILQAAFPRVNPTLAIKLGSAAWELTSLDEYKRLLKWYRDTHKYTWDEYDCNVYGWVMTAEALKWMHGKFPWGYIWAGSNDPEYPFPSHGFCFILDHEKKLYFCDELCVAAPNDEFEPLYPVSANLIAVN